MVDGDTIAQVAVVILLLGLSVPALATAYDYAGTPFEYEEQLTVDYNNSSQVAENATQEGYGDSPSITVDSTNLTKGTDYNWYDSNGTVVWLNTSNTDDGDTATIVYEAYQRTDVTRTAHGLISPFWALFGLFGFVTTVRALWEYTAEVWDL